MIDTVNVSYNEWLNHSLEDHDLEVELHGLNNLEEIKDHFYKDLEFGTGGLRGVIGVGTNRMNIYTVGKASQGYANYLNANFSNPSVAIAYDSRIKSDIFGKRAAQVFAANGIKVHMFKELMPTPTLSFAVRELGCSGGIVITASHNPAKYNGYKVYGKDGCQITSKAAKEILGYINKVDIFNDIDIISFTQALELGKVHYIEEEVIDSYLSIISKETFRGTELDKNVSIVYTPLNGTGLHCVTRILKENGFNRICVVKEQELPDGNFPTCPYPNPEEAKALHLGVKLAKQLGSDLVLATDPDCDRIGIAVKNGDEYTLLNANETGTLLFNYICKSRIENNTMPKHPVLAKTIVTTDMVNPIAKDYGVAVCNTLTGFKYIGELIGQLDGQGEADRFIFGFEESYGYLTSTKVRDKDGVNAALLICEMFAYYKSQGQGLIEVLDELYNQYGCYKNSLKSFTFEGIKGFDIMQQIMNDLREKPFEEVLGYKVLRISDFKSSILTNQDGTTEKLTLPPSNVLKFELEGDCSVIVRPSGTEPKIKLYFSVKGENVIKAEGLTEALIRHFEDVIRRYS